jgi:hypothetical protein
LNPESFLQQFDDESLEKGLADTDGQIKRFKSELRSKARAETQQVKLNEAAEKMENFDPAPILNRIKEIQGEKKIIQARIDELNHKREGQEEEILKRKDLLGVDKDKVVAILEAIKKFTPDMKKQLMEASLPNPKDRIIIRYTGPPPKDAPYEPHWEIEHNPLSLNIGLLQEMVETIFSTKSSSTIRGIPFPTTA